MNEIFIANKDYYPKFRIDVLAFVLLCTINYGYFCAFCSPVMFELFLKSHYINLIKQATQQQQQNKKETNKQKKQKQKKTKKQKGKKQRNISKVKIFKIWLFFDASVYIPHIF